MSGWDFTPEEEDQLFDELDQIDQKTQQFRATANPAVAQNAGALYRDHPYAPPGAILSFAKAMANGQVARQVADRVLADAAKNAVEWAAREQPEKKKKSWWDNAFSKLKTATRYTMAGLNFVPQTVQGAAAQIFDENDSVDGWFISTDLGSLIANDEVAGDGWFMGGRAAELQAQRAREYRGEIDGHAFTIGRGIAHALVQPGTKPYNWISGIADAAAAIAVPAAPGAKVVAGAVKGASAQTGLRIVAGLAEAESAAIDVNKVAGFLRSASGRSVIKRIAEIESVEEAMRIFPNVQDPTFWVKAVDNKTEKEVLDFLEEGLGTYGPQRVDDINISRIDDAKNWMSEKFRVVGRLFDKVPGGHLVLQGDNARDSALSIRNLDNYLKSLRVERGLRTGLVEDYTRALVESNGDIYQIMDRVQDISRVAMKKVTTFQVGGKTFVSQTPDELIDALLDSIAKYGREKTVYGAVDDLADPTSYGAKVFLRDGSLVDAPMATAGLQSEMLQQAQVMLPDPRQVRRVMSKIGWITGKGAWGKKLGDPAKYRELRLPLSLIESAQQEIWRPITLMTPGYALRNMTDSAFRLSFKSGMKGGVFHPLQWIQIAAYKKFKGDLLGQVFDADDAAKVLDGSMDEFADAVGTSIRDGYDPVRALGRQRATKVWSTAKRADPTEYRKGIMDEVSLLHDDAVTRALADGRTVNEVVDDLMNTDAGRRYLRQLQGRWSNRTFRDAQGNPIVGSADIIRADGTINQDNVRFFVDNYAARRLRDITRDNPLLVDAVATGKFTDAAGNQLDIFDITSGGRRVGYNRAWADEVQKLVDSGADLKDVYKFRIETSDLNAMAGKFPLVKRMLAGWDKTTDKFFAELYPKRSAYLMQSPVFRQMYYKQIDNLFDELDTVGVGLVRKNLDAAATAQKKVLDEDWLADWVGDRDLAKRMMDRFQQPTSVGNGKLTLAELDAYAKGYALDETKKLFYNVAERSNAADILRVIAPFGSAWAEVMSTWGKIAMTNPEAIKRVGVITQGLRDMDPDADGKGFFWKDPVTGEYVFNYPFSKQLGPLVSAFGGISALGGAAVFGLPGAAAGLAGGAALGAGLQAAGMATPGTSLIAPAKTLTMGLQVIPSVGPFVQIAASKILGSQPQADDLRRFLAPYGEPDIDWLGPAPVPSWAKKVIAATSDPENNRLLGDLTVDVMQVLQMSGDYNLAEASERERLENDAIGRARVLLMMRGLGQFVGPTRPDVEFKVDTYQGDMFTREISRAFRLMQDENYDTAVVRFLDTFGDDAFLYVAGKSKAVAGGLDASKQFGEFERQNTSLFARYRDVAGYFAPVGEKFDYQVYLRQLQTGTREKLKPSDLIEQAQSLVGRSLYKSLVRQVGPNPNEAQRAALREARKTITDLFPGYGTTPININKLPGEIQQLIAASFDPILDGNPVAEASREYFRIRQLALDEAARRGFTSLGGRQVADLRGMLRSTADVLVKEYPEFERLYDRVLFNEIDVDFGE